MEGHMGKQENAVLTVVGVNDVGILARTATCVAEANGNVVQVSQIVMDRFFTMNMLIDITGLKGSIKELEDGLKESLPGMEVHLMHENIFNSMHRI
jgi:ACT domain-containing protein